MAISGTITASKQIAWSGTNYTYYLTFNWQRVATGTDSNGRPTSTIRWNLYTNRSNSTSGTYYTITSESAISSNGTLNYSRGSRGSVNVGNGYYLFSDANFSDTSRDFIITHNADGTAPAINITIQMNAIYSSDTGKVTTTQSINVDSIPVQAELLSVTPFNDEGNPTITYNNPAGENVTTLQAIISLSAPSDPTGFVATRDISKTGTSYTFELTEAERVTLRQHTPSNVRPLLAILKTVINGNTFYTTKPIQFTIVNANPIFSDFTYKDKYEVLSDDQILVQNESTLQVTISTTNKMIAQKEATPSKYTVTIDDINVTQNYSSSEDIKFEIDIPTSGTKRLTVTAYDSRNNSTSVSKDIVVLPYSLPVINASVTRLNNFENTTTIAVSGTYSQLTVNNVDENTINKARYRYRETGGSYGSWTDFTKSVSNGTYTCTNATINLDNTKSYEVEIRVTDELNGVVNSYIVDIGEAIFFISSNQRKLYYNGDEIAVLDSPTFTGTPTAPTPANGDNSTKIATTEFVKNNSKKSAITVGANRQQITFPSSWTYVDMPIDGVWNSTGNGFTLQNNKIIVNKNMNAILSFGMNAIINYSGEFDYFVTVNSVDVNSHAVTPINLNSFNLPNQLLTLHQGDEITWRTMGGVATTFELLRGTITLFEI